MITAAANGLIRHNSRRIEKKVIHRKGPGRPVAAVTCPDERMEAEVIAREIEARMGGTSHFRLMGAKTSADYSPTASSCSDFAVFFRTNAQIRGVRDALTEWGIPCQVVGEKQSAGVRDVAEALRKALGPGLAAHASFEALLDMAAGQVSLRPCDGSLLRSLVSTYRDMPLEEAVLAAIDELSLLGEGDAFDPRADAVALMTLHAAKGLEFAVAFIAGVEDGLLPFTLHGDEADIEEERRLFYVGMTRAKDELFLLHAASRFLYGKRQALPPSRFLSEIPPGAMRTEVAHGKGKGRPRGKQTSLF
jgi:superfamily I DNA/RNA helicase